MGGRAIVLDDPTAAVDPKAKARHNSESTEPTGDRTILSSLGLGITRMVHRILVFDNGRIAKDGNHTTNSLGRADYMTLCTGACALA